MKNTSFLFMYCTIVEETPHETGFMASCGIALMLHDAVLTENPSYSILGNTAQRASGDFARHLLTNFPSYFTKMLVNTSSIH
ncbi:hypothetical protein, partial [uncultured Ruminococcus sp.]|uniref:hypothetical protein n=1 Tax=uncultured Ruminococcus sp. TaxID=165186 RepID=UPI00266BA32E